MASGEVSNLEAALDLLRRLPPQRVERNLNSLLQLIPSQATRLLNTVDVPNKVRVCTQSGREFLLCDYNRDGDSYRSPWSNEYEPALEDESAGLKPSEELRKLEIIANEAFSTYKSLYYDGGVSSVYLWDVKSSPSKSQSQSPTSSTSSEQIQFGAAILIKKEGDEGSSSMKSGSWDAIHIVEVAIEGASRKATYKLTTTVILHLDAIMPHLDNFILSGQVTRQLEQTHTLSPPTSVTGSSPSLLLHQEHVITMGRMVEEMESRMRSSMQEIYFGKTHDVINEIRPIVPAGFLRHQSDLHGDLSKEDGDDATGAAAKTPASRMHQGSGPSSLLAAAAMAGLANLRKTKKPTEDLTEDLKEKEVDEKVLESEKAAEESNSNSEQPEDIDQAMDPEPVVIDKDDSAQQSEEEQ